MLLRILRENSNILAFIRKEIENIYIIHHRDIK